MGRSAARLRPGKGIQVHRDDPLPEGPERLGAVSVLEGNEADIGVEDPRRSTFARSDGSPGIVAVGCTPRIRWTPAARSAAATREARDPFRWNKFTSTSRPATACWSRATSFAARAATFPLTLTTG